MSHFFFAFARPRGLIHLVSVTILALADLVVVPTVAAAEPVKGGQEGVVHVPPVGSPVVDEFRAPAQPFGPGNRGLEYDTEPGQEVRASAGGEVVFAGQVARSLHVTVRHADGVRTSYSFLSEVGVMVGERVAQGDRLGAAGGKLHFGARLGDSYFDPATLFGGLGTRVELLPFEVPPGSVPLGEIQAISQIIGGGGGWGISLPSLPSLPGLDDAVAWLVDRGRQAGSSALEVDPLAPVLAIGWDVAEHVIFPPECTAAEEPVPPPPGDRLALTIGGLGSSSSSSSVDNLNTEALGYSSQEVARFSYAGGLTPATAEATRDRLGAAGVPVTTYTSGDTQGDLEVAAAHLADVVEAAAGAAPEVVVDLFAHSLGGVVVRLALLELDQRGFPLEQLGVVATLGAPHQGTNLATAVDTANRTANGREALAVLEEAVDTGLDPQAEAIAQLAEGSPLVAELEQAGVPDEVDLVSVSARGDVTVPAPRSRVGGARNVTVPETGWSAHGEMVASEHTTRELGLALADRPPRCVGIGEVFQDAVWGHGIATAQDLSTAGLGGLP